jgi:lipopolysaccharide heptosyltransferase II
MQGVLTKTLIIRLSSVGDIVLSTPLPRLLRQRFPHCQIDYLTRSEYADLLRHNPHLSHLLEFPSGGTFRDLHRLRERILASRYDLIIDLHDSLRSRYLTFGTAPVTRVNKRKLARWVLVHLKFDLYDYLGGHRDVADRYIETIAQLGIRDDGQGTEIFIPAEAVKHAEELLPRAGETPIPPIVGICPSARHATKQWPAERFSATAAALARETGGMCILFGSAGEVARCKEILMNIKQDLPDAAVLDLSGQLTLLETAAAMDRCAVVITNDSGLMHLAAARQRKIVAIFGSTTEQLGFFPPRARSVVLENTTLRCRPCSHIGRAHCPKKHFRCMVDISAPQVIEAARRQLSV